MITKHYLYPVWSAIIQRCTNPKNSSWPRYGGRGIGVFEAWREFKAFRDGIIGEIGDRPPGEEGNGKAAYSLDRIDNDRGYEPGNLRWADRVQQGLNRHHGTLGYDPNSKWGAQRSAGLCGMYTCKSPPEPGRTLCTRHAKARRKFATESERRRRAKRRMSNTESE